MPSWINNDLYKESAAILKEKKVQYADMISYHQMCRWNSGMFYKHPALASTQYYWRVEPKVHFFCDVDYDVFRYMQDNNKTYGFTVNLYDSPESIPTLWPETEKFIAEHPEYVHENNAMSWLTDKVRRPEHHKKANGYSTCHFWSNFEIADMSFWRSKAYEDYFNHLDRAGGFFYERWGDAPVHSIALGLFEDSSRIHWCVFPVGAPGRCQPLTGFQVPRHRVPAHPLLQLPQLAQVQGLRGRPLYRRRELAPQGGLPAQLVQVCRHELRRRLRCSSGVSPGQTGPARTESKSTCTLLLLSGRFWNTARIWEAKRVFGAGGFLTNDDALEGAVVWLGLDAGLR